VSAEGTSANGAPLPDGSVHLTLSDVAIGTGMCVGLTAASLFAAELTLGGYTASEYAAAEEGVGSVFYSGGSVAREAAVEFAETNGGTVLEVETTGMSQAEIQAAVRSSSTQFAQTASGEVHVFQGMSVDTSSTWATVEYPTLMENPNVTGIVFHIVGW